MVASVIDGVTGIMDKLNSILEQYGDMVDRENIGLFFAEQLKTILPSSETWINADTIENYIKVQLTKAKEEDNIGDAGGFGDDFGGGGMDDFGGDFGNEDFGDEDFGNEDEGGGEDMGEEPMDELQ